MKFTKEAFEKERLEKEKLEDEKIFELMEASLTPESKAWRDKKMADLEPLLAAARREREAAEAAASASAAKDKKSNKDQVFELTHARHDPAHCLAPGLFRNFKRGDRKNLKLDITYTYGSDSIRFWGPEPLGPTDLLVLQGLVALATANGKNSQSLILRDPEKLNVSRLQFLDLKWDAIESDAAVVKGNVSQLCRELGYSFNGGKQFKTIRESIERLWSVSVIVDRDGSRKGFRILADYASKENEGKIFIVLNPRLTEAILGNCGHTHIDMAEIRAIKLDSTRLLHQRLCGWINPGDAGLVTLNTLCAYVWPDEVTNPNTVKYRRRIVRKALAELLAIDWAVLEYEDNKFQITRPPLRCLR